MPWLRQSARYPCSAQWRCGGNALLFISIPWIALCIYAESQRVRNPKLYLRLNSQLLIWLFLIMVLLWWVLRNIFNW